MGVEALLYTSYMVMYRPKAYGFVAVLVWNKVTDFAFLVWNRVWFWQGIMPPHKFIYFSCYAAESNWIR